MAGAIFAAMTVEFNNRISSITLVDIAVQWALVSTLVIGSVVFMPVP
ncbi:putative multidrug resistance domain protein [Acinetobacter sp. AR_0276]|nr:putative multidrug resistance domain protein [Acinetobacter sp. AR_0276]